MNNLNFYYFLTGFENCLISNIKFTFTELSMNEGAHKDTEIFYSLQEQAEIVTELELYKPKAVYLNRDDKDSIGLIVRVGQGRYNQTNIATIED
jgi:hypothetical protein